MNKVYVDVVAEFRKDGQLVPIVNGNAHNGFRGKLVIQLKKQPGITE